MKETDEVQKERQNVDNFIITALITLIAAFIVILSIKKPTNNYVAYSSIFSLFCLIVSLLFCLWHRFRSPLRARLAKSEADRIIYNISGEIADFVNNFVSPARRMKTLETIKNKQLSTESNIINTPIDPKQIENEKKVIISYLNNLNFQFKESHDKIFNKPLDEKGRRIKFFIDRLAKTLRYPLFVAGLVFFFVSIILNLLK